MNKTILLAIPALLLTACSPAATADAEKPTTETAKAGTPDTAPAANDAGAAAASAPFVPQGNLNDGQKALAVDMHNLVMERAILGRLTEKCTEFSIDEAKMSAERDRIIKAAQPLFPNKEDFFVASGSKQQQEMGEKVRQFYADRNVVWDSSSAEYCAVGKTLKGQTTGAGRYLR